MIARLLDWLRVLCEALWHWAQSDAQSLPEPRGFRDVKSFYDRWLD